MQRFVDGDSASFDVLYKRHASTVYGFACRMLRDGALAEDVLQTTFMSVVRSKNRYEPGLKVVPWLVTIAANAARDVLRRQQRVRDASSSYQAEVPVSVEPAPADLGARRLILDALQSLPEQQREAVLMHKVYGFSFEEIAESLGTTSTAARLRAHRGYARLKTALGQLEGV